ncbi:alpha/beta fold hydrolase [Streptantibioticus rubrisoli]|uniref:Alpha/beta hydrolase n=1 Tax=Streptantibioticus rubrisoli TaxID=1387313 RepID=A0ABT1P758_9ACTN|nr:alpha/beta fold hydrolase [Streptantibioticus rubrisoli]MCQ4041211.1 alpha/beta hydrolase [Streptantibioticus rubrisoli]
MTTYVLIPGACHGGWWYQSTARELRQHGHDAYALTLTGIGDRAHLLSASVNLDTHIEDVVRLLEDERIEDAVLVGHSYGGMVIAGAADRVPQRVDALVYVDAFVPEDGDSCWTLTNDWQHEWYMSGSAETGFALAPLDFFDPRTTAHPLASLLQRIRLTGALEGVRRRDYVWASEFQDSPFTRFHERLHGDPAWRTHALPTGHNVMRDGADDLLKILLDVAER